MRRNKNRFRYVIQDIRGLPSVGKDGVLTDEMLVELIGRHLNVDSLRYFLLRRLARRLNVGLKRTIPDDAGIPSEAVGELSN